MAGYLAVLDCYGLLQRDIGQLHNLTLKKDVYFNINLNLK